MDNIYVIYLMLALMGVIYFGLYRLLAYKLWKWSMIRSIWIPLIYCIATTAFALSLLSTPWFGANRSVLSIIGVLTELNLPVISFLILFIFFLFKDKKSKQ